jgi:nucleoside-diphosphate-sugar epimerase
MNMKQRIALIGGDNFVGRSIANALQASNWAEPVVADWRKSYEPIVSECDAVVSCTMGSATAIRESMQQLSGAIETTNAAMRLVHVSSMTVYGAATGLIDEFHPPVGKLSDYAQARFDAERMTQRLSNVVTLRPGCEYGPGCTHWSERVAHWLMARRLGDLGAAGDGYCNLTYIDDLAQATVRALEVPAAAGHAFNIATDTPPTWNEYFTRFALALKATPVRRVTSRRLKIETKLLAPILKMAEIAALKLSSKRSPLPPAIPPSLLQLCQQEIRLDVRQAERVLGLRWQPIDDGLSQAAIAIKSALG